MWNLFKISKFTNTVYTNLMTELWVQSQPKEIEISYIGFKNKNENWLRVDGLIISNTTVTRPVSLQSVHQGEAGGLSGAPLRKHLTWRTWTINNKSRDSSGKPFAGMLVYFFLKLRIPVWRKISPGILVNRGNNSCTGIRCFSTVGNLTQEWLNRLDDIRTMQGWLRSDARNIDFSFLQEASPMQIGKLIKMFPYFKIFNLLIENFAFWYLII